MNRLKNSRGFSLMELMVALVLTSVMLTLTFTGLGKARTSGSSRGMATAVAAELRLAREKAIAKGSPVAVVFPKGVGRSLFYLEGETLPVVTKSVNYEGDYPEGAITMAMYGGSDYTKNIDVPGSKSQEWEARINTWLPTEYKDDFVFMFTPNGSVVTNDLPAADGAYRLQVSVGAEVTSDGAPKGEELVNGPSVYYKLKAAGEPYTLAVSQSGAVEQTPQLLGSNGSVNTNGAISPRVTSPVKPDLDYDPEFPDIFYSRVTPPPEMIDGTEYYVIDKGEYLTLEVFAHSGDGRPLYAGWKDTPTTKPNTADYQGRFSVPGGKLERMEFYPEYDVYEDPNRKPVKDVWRSVWTWTPPKTAEAGDKYTLAADVTDAKIQKKAAIKDPPKAFISPPGEVIFERQANPGDNWHIYSMWADGKRMKRLTEGPYDYRYASATANGELIAYERSSPSNPNSAEVWVSNADGTGPQRIGAGASPTISPTGDSIAYTNLAGDKITVQRLEGSGNKVQVPTVKTVVTGVSIRANRIGYSADGRWVYYTSPDSNSVSGTELLFTGTSGINTGVTKEGAPVGNIASSYQVGGVFTGRHGQIYYHADIADPYIGRYDAANGERGGQPGVITRRTSRGHNECFPSISPNEDLLLFCEEDASGRYQIKRVPMSAWTTSVAGTPITSTGENLRPAWLKQKKPL